MTVHATYSQLSNLMLEMCSQVKKLMSLKKIKFKRITKITLHVKTTVHMTGDHHRTHLAYGFFSYHWHLGFYLFGLFVLIWTSELSVLQNLKKKKKLTLSVSRTKCNPYFSHFWFLARVWLYFLYLKQLLNTSLGKFDLRNSWISSVVANDMTSHSYLMKGHNTTVNYKKSDNNESHSYTVKVLTLAKIHLVLKCNIYLASSLSKTSIHGLKSPAMTEYKDCKARRK